MATLLQHRSLRIALHAMILVIAGTAPSWAQEAPAQPADDEEEAVLIDTSAIVTPAARDVLDRMTASLNALGRFSVTAHITRDEILPYGYKLQNNESAHMLVERPNRLRVDVTGDMKNRSYVYDGSKLTVFAKDLDVYASSAAPDTLGELVGVLLDAGVEMPLIDILYHGAAGNLTDDVRVGLVVGDSEVDGVATDHLAFRQPDVDWQLWVSKGTPALPRKLVITTRYEVGDPQYQATLRWDLKPRVHAKAFEFVPPKGASEITFHTDLATTGGDQ